VEKKKSRSAVRAVGQGREDMNSFLQLVKWDEAKYIEEYDKTLKNMGGPFTREARDSSTLGLRMAVMSGLHWNHESKTRKRDWNTVTTIITIETALVQTYRQRLLDDDSCSGARALRSDLQAYLKSAAPPYQLQMSSQRPISHKSWDYPDNIIPHPKDKITTTKVYDVDELDAHFQEVEDGSGRPNPIKDWVHKMERDQRLFCSSKSKFHGTIESRAYHAITILSNVRPSQPLSGSLIPPSQIMYLNDAQIKYERDADDTDDNVDVVDDDPHSSFEMSSVTIPKFVHKPHAVTLQYCAEVRSRIDDLHNITYYDTPPAWV
jgi:hypothetical protein